MFTMDVSFIIVTMVVLGGTGSITGSAIAAVLLFYLPEKMRDISDIRLGSLVAIGIAIALGVAAMRAVMNGYHGPKLKKAMMYVGVIVAALLFSYVGGMLLSKIPALAEQVEGIKLRLVVFAVTLIVLMLLRPQGIFGHHEFSWSWVQRLFGKRTPQTEVAA
jgi:branched-chain amino acid transport system permease protein